MSYEADHVLEVLGEPVTLANGRVVKGIPGVTTIQDALAGDATVAVGQRTLRLSAASGVKSDDRITWGGKPWKVINPRLVGNGVWLKVFLTETR